MAEFADFLANGVLLGALYALLAMPMVLIWSTTDVLDINVGGYVVVSGIVAATVGGVAGIVAGVAAAMAVGAVTGLIFLAFHRLWDQPDHMRLVLATFGLLFIVQALVQSAAGTDNHYLAGPDGRISLAGVDLSVQRLLDLAVAVAILAGLLAVLQRTPAGLRMRAAALVPSAAELVGVRVRRVQFLVFLLGAGMAGVVGVLAAMTIGVSYGRGIQFTTFAFSAVLLFGMRGPATAFAGGLVLGIVEGLSAGYLPSGWSAAIPPLLIVLVLAFGRFEALSVKQVRA